MKIALFLGAGASVPFNKPTTKGMREKLAGIDIPDNLDHEILTSLATTQGYRDVEYILQAIRDLRNLNQSTAVSFLNSQNSNFGYKNGNLPFSTLLRRLKGLESLIEREVYETYRWGHEDDKSLMIIYEKLFALIHTFSTLHVFTTNYDRAIETFCELRSTSFQCIDGFERSVMHSEYSKWVGKFDAGDNATLTPIRLYKLHGSLNWKLHRLHGIVKTNEESISSDKNYIRNIVIMPTLSPKEEEDQEPFRKLRNYFAKYMETADICIVIGFSFRDNLHEVFQNFVQRGKTLIVISPTAITDFHVNLNKENPTDKELDSWKAASSEYIERSQGGDMHDRNVHLLQRELKLATTDNLLNAILHIINKLPVE